MMKKMLGVFTSVVAALIVVGVAWAGSDDGTSSSVGAAIETSASVSAEDASSSTGATADSSSFATVQASTPTSVDAEPSSASTSIGGSSATGIDATTSTSIASTTSTSVAATTSTSTGSSTSTSVDDGEDRIAPDGVTTHVIPGVGSVVVEVFAGHMSLVSVTAPGWTVERDKVEPDRIELELTSALDAEAEFEARLRDGQVEARIEVDSD